MEHQYPVAITGDEHMLAELMLPDQAHARNQDWTIFFLHKDTTQEEDDEEEKVKAERRKRRRRRRDRAAGIIDEDDEDTINEEDEDDDEDDDDDDWDDESTDTEPEGGEGPPLVYVLNLVNTKHDKTVKRGAVVRAMAICTRHPFLHIYKVSENAGVLLQPTRVSHMLKTISPFYCSRSKNTSSPQFPRPCQCFTTRSTIWTCH